MTPAMLATICSPVHPALPGSSCCVLDWLFPSPFLPTFARGWMLGVGVGVGQSRRRAGRLGRRRAPVIILELPFHAEAQCLLWQPNLTRRWRLGVGAGV